MSYPNVAALRNGMLVAVSLNAAVSTAFVDPELDQMANKLETGKYLAILSGLVSFFHIFPSHRGLRKLNLKSIIQSVDQDGNSLTNMYFIGKGMPRHDSQYDEDETMSIPVLPNKAHPLRRQPLQLQQPLPWPGCYIRTLVTERQVRINSVTPSKTASVNMLQATDFKPLISLCETDLRRAKPSEIVVSASDNGFESDGSSAVDHDDDDWDMETHSRASELTLTFDVWLDTGVFASGLPDPSHLRTELERLYM